MHQNESKSKSADKQPKSSWKAGLKLPFRWGFLLRVEAWLCIKRFKLGQQFPKQVKHQRSAQVYKQPQR